MTALEFLKGYSYDARLVTGAYYPTDPVDVQRGDTVGVVLMNLGGPRKSDEVEPFLYNLFMDPAIIDIPLKGRLRHWVSRLISRVRAKSVGKDYDLIGGGSPINKLTEEQARALERKLNKRFGQALGVTFKVYVAMRYWHPTSEEAALQMEKDGVKKVVLLPLYPQYSKTTTGSSLLYWDTLEQAGAFPAWPTSFVYEFAAHPKYIQSISDRIDEGLQRFPKDVRESVQIVFSAHGTPLKEMAERRDPYCCHVHSTVDRVMALRQNDHPYHVAFQSKVGPAEWLTPSTPDKLEELADQGHTAVLIVPVAFVTDHIETLYELDIEVREEAHELGITHFEVTSGLNCHPLFIDALSEVTVSQLGFEPGSLNGEAYLVRHLVPQTELPRYRQNERTTRCHQCKCIAECVRWDAQPQPEVSPQRLAS